MPCFYCGVRLRKSGSAMRTRDHVVPKSKGGNKTVDACLRCNGAKRDLSLESFRQLCGGIEFWGEKATRLARMETSWVQNFDAKKPIEKRTVVAKEHERPVYKATFDLSKIRQYTRVAKTKKEAAQEKREKPNGTPCPPPDLLGVKFGAFTVIRRLVGKWEVECMCGAIDHRSSKAVRNPANTFDTCDDCRKPIGRLRSDIFKEFGMEISWEDCFQHIYGEPAAEQEASKDDPEIR